MRKYRLIAKKGEGTFSEVLKAQSVKNGKCYAIKCMKTHFTSIEQVNNLREIQALRRLSPHPNIVQLEEVLYDKPTGRLALVFELMDMNLYELIRGRRHHLDPQLVKIYMFQLLRSLAHMHRKGVFHRDLKPENILIENNYDVHTGLKLADFGSCRGTFSKQPYTEYISTRWYRAPECLLTDGYYGAEMDIWGAGCVMFEISCLFPLAPGENEVDQIKRIHSVFGTPPAQVMSFFKSRGSAHVDFKSFTPQKGKGLRKIAPNLSDTCLDLLTGMLQYDPRKRITADQALAHEYFAELRRVPEPSFSPVARKASTGSTAHRPTSDSTGGALATKPAKHASPKHASPKHASPTHAALKPAANAGSEAVAAAAASLTSPAPAAADTSLPAVGVTAAPAVPTTLPKRNKGTRRASTDKRKASISKSTRRDSEHAGAKKPPVTPLTLDRAPDASPTHGEDRAGSPFNPQDSQDSPTNAALKRARRHKRQKEREARRAAAAAAAAAAEAAEAAAAVVAAAAKHRGADGASHLSPRDPLALSGRSDGPLDLSGSFAGVGAGAGAGAGAGLSGSMGTSGDFSNVKTGVTHRKHRSTHRSTDGASSEVSHASTRRRRERHRHRDKERRRDRDRSYDDDSDGGGRRRRRESVDSDSKRSTLPAIDAGGSTYHGPDATNESLPPIHGQSSTLYHQRSPVAAKAPGGNTFTHRDRSSSPTAGRHLQQRVRAHHSSTDPTLGHQYKSYASSKQYRSPKHAGSTGHGQPSHTGRSKYEHRNRKYSQPAHAHRQVGHSNRGAGGQQPLVGLAAGHGYNASGNASGSTARRRNKHVRSRYATYFSDKRGNSNPVVKKKPGLLSVHGTSGRGGAGERLVSINAPKHNYHLPRGSGAPTGAGGAYRQFRM